MARLRLAFLQTATLSVKQRDDLRFLIDRSVTVLSTADEVLAGYRERVARVCIAYETDRPVAFQFYQRVEVENTPVLHFALSVKDPDWQQKGINYRMGQAIYLRIAPVAAPFCRFAVAALVDNPKSYANLLRLGGQVWPRILAKDSVSERPPLYEVIARRLAVPELDPATGLVPRRVAQRGLDFRPDAYESGSRHPVNAAYAAYVARGAEPVPYGIFTVVMTSMAQSAAALFSKRMRTTTR